MVGERLEQGMPMLSEAQHTLERDMVFCRRAVTYAWRVRNSEQSPLVLWRVAATEAVTNAIY